MHWSWEPSRRAVILEKTNFSINLRKVTGSSTPSSIDLRNTFFVRTHWN